MFPSTFSLLMVAAAAFPEQRGLPPSSLRGVRHSTSEPRLMVIGVSGQLEEGFDQHWRLDYFDENTGERVNATFLGLGLARGAKMFFDSLPEYRAEPGRANPAVLLTGDWCDANQYALYLVDERQVLTALQGEPRMLAMTPDSLLVQLDDPGTAPQVAKFARALFGDDLQVTTVLAVVGTFKACSFLAAPPYVTRSDCTRVTTFHDSMAMFAGIANTSDAPPSSEAWNSAVGKRLNASSSGVERACKQSSGETCFTASVAKAGLYGTPSSSRLSKAMPLSDVRKIADQSGITLQV